MYHRSDPPVLDLRVNLSGDESLQYSVRPHHFSAESFEAPDTIVVGAVTTRKSYRTVFDIVLCCLYCDSAREGMEDFQDIPPGSVIS